MAEAVTTKHVLSHDVSATIPRHMAWESEFTAKMLNKAEHSVVELKIPPHRTGSDLANELQHVLKKEEAYQGISKKATTFNLIADELWRNGEAYKIPRHDTEIEAKLELDGDGQDVFHEIMDDFAKGDVEGFRLSPDYPRVLETGKLHSQLAIF